MGSDLGARVVHGGCRTCDKPYIEPCHRGVAPVIGLVPSSEPSRSTPLSLLGLLVVLFGKNNRCQPLARTRSAFQQSRRMVRLSVYILLYNADKTSS